MTNMAESIEAMARHRGRKRKIGDRHPGGEFERMPKDDKWDKVRRARQRALCGREDLSPDYPLHILLGRGLIHQDRNEAARLCTAGMQFAALYWRLFGRPFAHATDLGVAGGRRGRQTAAQRLRDERLYTESLAALDASGRAARAAMIEYAVYLRFDWFMSDIVAGAPLVSRHDRKLDAIRAGLSALADMPMVRLSDAEIEEAEAQAS